MRVILFSMCLFLSVATMAQQKPPVQYTMTKDQLEAKKREIQESIKETEQQLEAVKNKKGATLAELRVLQNQLASRQSLINNINDQLGDIESTIKLSSKEVVNLRQKLDQLKIRYAQSIRYAYTTRSSYDMLAFLFSSRDFNDAMRRMKYLKKFRDFRKDQVEQIYMTQTQLQHKIGSLNATKEELVSRQKEKVEQTQKLKEETEKQSQVVQELKGKESELMRSIEKDRAVAGRVNKAIQHYIELEMERAQKAAEEEERKRKLAEANSATKTNPAKPNPPGGNTNNTANTGNNNTDENVSAPAGHARPRPAATSGDLVLTPTDVALASSFEGNKGKLYWPVDRGYISDHFGPHPHPVETHVVIDNSGVDIQTSEGAPIKVVYDGLVTNVFSVAGDGSQIVMVSHGNYFTVYNGLSSVSVTKGQHVTTRQVIGKVAVGDDNIPTIKFQIWKGIGKGKMAKLNPEQWLGKAH